LFYYLTPLFHVRFIILLHCFHFVSLQDITL
jgi:hypothetical protein